MEMEKPKNEEFQNLLQCQPDVMKYTSGNIRLFLQNYYTVVFVEFVIMLALFYIK